jgi:hypothetical protein
MPVLHSEEGTGSKTLRLVDTTVARIPNTTATIVSVSSNGPRTTHVEHNEIRVRSKITYGAFGLEGAVLTMAFEAGTAKHRQPCAQPSSIVGRESTVHRRG